MTDLSDRVLVEIRRIAKAELNFEGPIEPPHRLQRDLQFDSMGMIVIAVALENRFRIRLHEEDAGGVTTVEDLMRLVCRRVDEQEPS